jgi:hypothetical protein
VASDAAGGGDVPRLRAELAELRVSERVEGTERAEEAARELERAVGKPPRLASPGYLDRVGAAARGLEQALGRAGSPFGHALAAASGSVDAFVREVEGHYLGPLR